MKKKNKIPKRNLKKEIIIPPKIHEIISYLAFSFTSGVLERDDNKQFLYLKYIETIRRHPKAAKNDPGWFFLKFKWLLITRYGKEVKRINRDWNYMLQDCDAKTDVQNKVGYLKDKD